MTCKQIHIKTNHLATRKLHDKHTQMYLSWIHTFIQFWTVNLEKYFVLMGQFISFKVKEVHFKSKSTVIFGRATAQSIACVLFVLERRTAKQVARIVA